MRDASPRPPAESWRAAIVGPGALGTALALRLHTCGVAVEAVLGRSARAAATLAGRIGARSGSLLDVDLPASVNLIACCTPDRALAEVGRLLADARPHWEGTTVLHTSGAVPASVFQSLASRGALPLGFHPVQTFTAGTPPSAFDGIYVGIEGSTEALRVGARLAETLGTTPIEVPTDEKASYHLACVWAANALTALLHAAAGTLAPLGIDDSTAQRILAPLVDRAVANTRATSPADALTGPLVRADLDTLAAHLAVLARHAPERVPLYFTLAEETLRMAHAGGRMTNEAAAAVQAFLDAHPLRSRD